MAKKIIKWTLIVLAILVVGFVGLVAMQPSDYRVERSTTIAATPTAVFPHINDFHNWNDWSPWAKIDPNCKYWFEGPSEGEGAIFRWAGNHEVGEGSMTIVESKPDELVQIRLDFIKPFAGTATTQLDLKPEADKTLVTWSMWGENDFIGRAMCLIMDMDAMIGGKYEEGLASLKKAVETTTVAE